MLQLPPVTELQLTNPDDLTLGEIFAIRAATGVDVQEPDTTVGQITALLWFALKSRDPKVSWSDMHSLKAAQLEPYWSELVARNTKAAADLLVVQAGADQARDDAAALEEQRIALGEEPAEPVPPTVDPT